jgi:hypothetical protein
MNSTNKRKFRIWDSKAIFQSLERVIQLQTKIEEKLEGNEIEDLPMSMIPTHIIYELAVCYEAMYDKLVDEQLITEGYPKLDPTKIH